MERRTLDAREVCELSGLALSTVYERAREGQLPGVLKVGRRLLFSRTKVLAWLEGNGGGRQLAGADTEGEG